jgi:basic membrane protein A
VLPFLSVFAALLIGALGGGAEAATRPLRVALVLDPGGKRDPYSRGPYEGLKRAVRELGVQGVAVTRSPKEDSATRFSALAAQRYDLVIGLGFYQASGVDVAATRFPGTRFALVDAPVEELEHHPPNVAGTAFREQEAGYLAGYLGALVEHERPGRDVVSAVAGFPLPAVERYLTGGYAGARKAVPGIRALLGYAKSFTDPAKCRAVALSQIAKGSGVVFQVASACGLGALEAAKERGVWGIGVDIDQSSLGPHILTSAVKRLDVAVFRIIQLAQAGTLPTGRNVVFDVRNGGVGLGKISPRVPRALVAKVERIRQQIASGAIVVPSS